MASDNSNLRAKLALRRHFLRKYHGDTPPRVFDACQGDGVIWSNLRREFDIASYWGSDVKPKRGRLTVDSRRLLETGIEADVVDIDTYGSPWRHYAALLKSLRRPATVFLTLGDGGRVAMQPGATGADILDLPRKTPKVLAGKMSRRISVSYWLTKSWHYGIMPVEIAEVIGSATARYFGVRLQPELQPHGSRNPDCVDRSHLQPVDGVSKGL